METKKTELEKVKVKHYDIAGISTIAILESIAERVDIPRKAIFPICNAVKYLLRCGAKQGESWRDEDFEIANNQIKRLIKIVRQQKYKRCLAMAEWCDTEVGIADTDGNYEDMLWYQKWYERWMKLAEQFKEAK